MATINEIMTQNHRLCDTHFASAEGAVAANDWPKAEQAWKTFSRAMNTHITEIEESSLFPAFEKVNGPSGPTQVMRFEHEQMRELMAQTSSALAERDSANFLGLAETLMLLMQQHNMKEEQMLYPMMDRSLVDAVSIAEKLRLETMD